MEKRNIGFIGAGNMARALGRGLAVGANLMIFDINGEVAERTANEVGGEVKAKEDIARECSYIFLAVKPNALCPALDGIRDILKERDDCVLVSMLAGVSIENVEVALGFSMPIIRIMPNTPVAVGRGIILWCPSETVKEEFQADFAEMMKSAGLVRRMDEGMIDAGTAISGCSPAFTYMFEKALAKAGVAVGLDKECAEELSKATVEGASMLSILDSRSLEELTAAVCSPGGSTIEGVKVLTDTLEELVGKAVRASYEKTKKLGK